MVRQEWEERTAGEWPRVYVVEGVEFGVVIGEFEDEDGSAAGLLEGMVVRSLDVEMGRSASRGLMMGFAGCD